MIVVKVGGAVAAASAEAVLALAREHDVVVVHGAGPQITDEMRRRGIPVEFVGGRRVTTPRALAVVRESFAAVNGALCAAIGPRAVPLFGDEIGLCAERVEALGLVGDPLPSRPRAVLEALADDRIPVVAPLGVGPLNVNADEAASALALGLGADRLLFLTDVDGLILDGGVVDAIDTRTALDLLDGGHLDGGIVPKLRAAAAAARDGVPATIGRTAVVGMSVSTHAPLLPTYARLDVTFVEGEGCWLVDAAGRRYLDLVAGIAVVALGHRHPAPLAAAHAQLDRLWHVSNLYSTEPMEALAERLSQRFGGARAFFCNSGAESVEAALKWARKATGKTEIVALEGSFHGRTMGALSVTGQPAKREPFAPLVPHVRFATPDTLADTVSEATAAIILEPVLGEGGVRPLGRATLGLARSLADEHGALLVFDEVQTGVGRTGSFFAWEQLGARPDAVTLAKGLANGLPIGALLVADDAPTAFEPGDHASTFGGNPVACAAACAVVDTVDDELLAHVRSVSARFARLGDVRGLGLLLAVELGRPAGPVVAAALERGLLVGTAGETALRLTPPLTITADEADRAIEILQEVL